MATNATAKRRKRQVVRAVAEVYADTRLVAPRLLHPNPWNINRMSERAFAGLKESIRLSGFCDPIEARAHGRAGHFQILGGEHRWRAARQLHMPRVSVNVLRVPSDVAARKLVLQLNAHGEVDLVDLAEELTHLQRELGADLGTGLPYTQRGLEELLALVPNVRSL